MPNFSANKQILGHSVSYRRTYSKGIGGRLTSELTSRNDLVIAGQTYGQRTSTITPNFKRLKRNVPLPVHGFSFELQELRYGNGSQNYFYGFDPVDHYIETGDHIGYSPSIGTYVSTSQGTTSAPLDPGELARLDSKANTQCLLHVKNMKVNIAQAWAEREQAMKMVAETAIRIAGALKDLKHGNIFGAAEKVGLPVHSKRQRSRINRKVRKSRAESSVDQLANDWLALQYGWKPLLSDIHGAAESLADILNQTIYKEAYGRARRRIVDKTVFHEEFVTGKGNTALTTYPAGVKVGHLAVNGVSEVSYGVRFASSGTTSHWPTALGITNPLELAWELLPFSFVADWFINVGDTLSTLDATIGLAFVDGYKTEFHKYEWVSTGRRSGQDGTFYYFNSYGSQTYKWVKTVRTKLTTFPSPTLPFFKDNPMTVGHMLNAIGLLVSQTK